MKITKDIWVLLTEYDDLNQIEIVLYKNNNGLKPYLYYTNDTNAALLKMDENEFLFFVKIDIKKNSEFKFAIVGDGDIVKYEIHLGNTSEECYMVKEEKYVAPVLANNKSIKEVMQSQESITDKNVNIKDIFDINGNDDNNEEIKAIKEDTAESIIEEILDDSIEEKNINENEEFEDNIEEEIEDENEEFEDNIEEEIEDENEEDIKIVEKEGLIGESNEKNLKDTNPLDVINEDKKENIGIFEDSFLSFQRIIDTIDKFDFSFGDSDISILKSEKIDFNENKTPNIEEIKVNKDETLDIEETKASDNDILNIDEIKVIEDDILNTDEIKVIEDDILNTDEIKAIEDDILNTDEIKVIEDDILNTDEIKVIEDDILNTDEIKVIEDDILNTDEIKVIEDDILNTDEIKASDNEILNIEETNANEDEISKNVEIIINKNETLNNGEIIQEKNEQYDSHASNIEQEEKALIVQSDKKMKKAKRKGLSFEYKMNKKIKIALIKIYRLMPNFIKGDYRRRINL